MTTRNDLLAASIQAAHEARSLINQITDKTDEARARELDEQANKAFAHSDALAARAKLIEDIEAREAALNVADPRRENENRAVATGDVSKEDRHAELFNAAMRGHELTSEQRAFAREVRDQSKGTNSAGGYLVPASFQATLINGMKSYGPMNEAGAISWLTTSTGNQLQWPTNDDTANMGSMIGEAAALPAATDLVFGQVALDAYKGTSGILKISSELLNDSELSIEAIIGAKLEERLGRLVNYQLTLGTGTNAPNGLVTSLGTPPLLTVANAVVTFDDLMSLDDQVDVAYSGGDKGVYMFNQSTKTALRKLKDTTGNYIYQESTRVGDPDRVLGHRFFINNDMASIATGTVPVVFGDLTKYQARRVKGIVIKRLDERYADTDQVGFAAFIRFDGDLMDPRAVKGIKVR
jgi:HK97 family phage major capsid protein